MYSGFGKDYDVEIDFWVLGVPIWDCSAGRMMFDSSSNYGVLFVRRWLSPATQITNFHQNCVVDGSMDRTTYRVTLVARIMGRY